MGNIPDPHQEPNLDAHPSEKVLGDQSVQSGVRRRWQNKNFMVGREFVFLFALVIVIAASSWGVIKDIESQEKLSIGRSLTSVLYTAHAGIKNQTENQIKSAQVWGNSEQIQSNVQALLKLTPEDGILINSAPLINLRMWITSLNRTVGYRGFFIIDRNNINLASSRDENVGITNLLEDSFLKRIWAGETLVSSPQFSDVRLQDIHGKMVESLPTMFVATPVKGADGRVLAVLAFRLEPDESFTPIFERSRFGDTGETFAFNQDGLLISESRFNAQLKKLKLIQGEHSDLLVELRDPGVNLTRMEKPSQTRDHMPLTDMVQNAIAGGRGLMLDTYRDYRGVSVVGAWVWDKDLGFGFATEIDAEEAFKAFYKIRIVILGFSGLSIATLLVLAGVFYRARQELITSEERYSRSQKYAHIGTWDWNIQTGELIWSSQIAPLFGYAEGTIETSYENFLKAIHPKDRRMVSEAVQACVEHKADYDIEHRVLWPDGSIHWVREKGDVEREPDGTPIRMLGIVIDIDDRKKGEETLAIHVKELDFQKDAMDEHAIVSVTNAQGNIIYANKKFCEISGYSEQELLGQNHRIIKSDEHLPEVYENLWKTISRGKVWQGEIKNKKKNGDSYWVMSTIVPFMNEKGKPFQYISIRTDVTKRKKAEMTALTANRAKTDLMANMSHELRTPLNAIIGFSGTMKAEIFGPIENAKYKEYLDDIHFSGEHLLALINDILDVSAIEAGALNLYEDTVSLYDVVDASIRIVGPRAEKGLVTITSAIDQESPSLFVDERRIKQVLLNLLTNAVKFTPEQGEVFVTSQENKDGSLSITVSDTGIGMDEDEIVMAMSTFGQVDSGLNRKNDGTGLGLPLTAGLMKMHGGTLKVHSKKGHGSQVIVNFPPTRIKT